MLIKDGDKMTRNGMLMYLVDVLGFDGAELINLNTDELKELMTDVQLNEAIAYVGEE